jgi:isocitrate dehydrogenase kinase/phosphatase
MSSPSDDHQLARRGAAAIAAAFGEYDRQFQAITRRAQSRFARGHWHAMQSDASERLELYGHVIAGLLTEIRALLGASVNDKTLWAVMKGEYSELVAGRADIELAETFFNSATRRIFTTVGVDPKIEFLFSEFDRPLSAGEGVYETYAVGTDLGDAIRNILRASSLSVHFEHLDRDARRVARAIQRERRALGITCPIDSIDMLRFVFYRNKGAYLVGRICTRDHAMPLTLALHHGDRGLYADAALLTEDEVSIIFSFTRAYFHVAVDRPRDLVAFLRSIMPRKPVAELYNAIGHNKHGKTELFRDLMGHIQRSTDPFEIAPGDRGLVMIVFTLPSFDVVFKVIRDTFAYPKTVTRRDVLNRYQLVFMHDRAGRLADVQEFEHLAFARSRFPDALLAELGSAAAETVTIGQRIVDIKHLYTQRRMLPLNLYLREVDAATASAAVVDYGQAIKDMAITNIFPGDMLLKNFGVTRHGRVVFYDYDELCPLTDCVFREMPQPSAFDEEFGAEPWFYVGPHDVFPEEFITFMGLAGQQREAFLAAHADLLSTRYWCDIQARLRAGQVIDIIPYRRGRRLTVEEPCPEDDCL